MPFLLYLQHCVTAPHIVNAACNTYVTVQIIRYRRDLWAVIKLASRR
jgi:hypothetical protein